MPRRPLSLVSLLSIAFLALACGDGPATERADSPAPPPPPPPEQAGERVSEILAIEAPLPRVAELAGLLARLDAAALPGVRRAIDGAGLEQGDPELALFAIWWSGFDPKAALAWTREDWTANSPNVLAGIYRTWAARDPQAAFASARSQFDPASQELATAAALTGWYETDTEGVLAFVRSEGDMKTQQRAADVVARRKVAEVGPRAALEWVEGLQDPGFQSLMSSRVASAVTWIDPGVAAEWATPRIDDGPRTSGLARRIAVRWRHTDPEAAMAWLSTLPAGGDREDGVTEAYRDWLNADFDAAVAWLEKEGLEPWLEPAWALYARRKSFHEPVESLAIVARFSDQELRERISTLIARAWLQRDRDAAEAWLEQSDLPEPVKKRARMTGPDQRARGEAAAAAPE